MKVVLVMFKDDERRNFPLRGQSVTIGRAPECMLRIPLRDVSRRHCELQLGAGTLTVKDLGSSNGTYVNGRRVAELVLSAGDVIEIGPVRFLAQIDGRPAVVTPHDLEVTRSPGDAAGKQGGKPSAAAPAATGKSAPAATGKSALAAPGKAAPAAANAAPAKGAAPARGAAPVKGGGDAATRLAPAAGSKPPAGPPGGGPAEELTEDDLFDLNDVEFDLSDGSWPPSGGDDEDDAKPPRKGGK